MDQRDCAIGPLTATAGSGTRLTRPLRLDRRTRHRAVRAEHAAVAPLWSQPLATARAIVKVPAGVNRHGFGLRSGAMRAGDDGLKDHLPFRSEILPAIIDVLPTSPASVVSCLIAMLRGCIL